MSSPSTAKKVCYYELLGVDRKCEAAEIKTAYRKLALRMHPDKAPQNGLTTEDATRQFQQIQEAYSVLSDPHERAWYDAHREQILKGDDEAGEDPFKTRINLYKYFSASCYDGFSDKAGGFYTTYAELFAAIDQEEQEWEDADGDHVPLPAFGNSQCPWKDVSAFYRIWLDFCSRKAFGHADKWNPREAQNRQVRRAMEQENKKARQTAKKEFNAEVRQLVRFVQKRDPRVANHQKQQMKESADKTKREKAEKEQRKAEEAEEKALKKEAARQAEQERWAEVKAAKEARRARGEIVSEDEQSSNGERETVQYFCEPCRKSFKSEKAFDQHTASKKHKQIIEQLQKQLEKEAEEEAEEEEEEEEEEEDDDDEDISSNEEEANVKATVIDLEAGFTGLGQGGSAASYARPASEVAGKIASTDRKASSVEATKDQQARANGHAAAADARKDDDGDEEEDSEEDDDDDFVMRLAATKKRAPFTPAPRTTGASGPSAAGGETESDAEDSEAEESSAEEDKAEEPAVVGKAAQKRERLKASLQAKLESEQSGTKKLTRRDKKKEAAAAAAAKGTSAASGGKSPKVGGGEDAYMACSVCSEVFPSRTKLFQHIRDAGHAALKEAPAPSRKDQRKKKG